MKPPMPPGFRPLNEGYVMKGGVNPSTSQIPTRPAPPAAMRAPVSAAPAPTSTAPPGARRP